MAANLKPRILPQLSHMRNSSALILRIIAALVVISLALSLRLQAVARLPIDYDEDDYMRAGQEYVQLIRAGDWAGFTQANYRPEHPPLAKIIIGISLLGAPEKPLAPDAATTAEPNKYLPRDLVTPARTWMAVLGTLTVAALALIDPLGALFLGLHTFTIKYVSQVMLEALPAFTSLLCAVAYWKWKTSWKGGSPRINGWLLGSALLLGLTAASKYLYCVVGIAILVDWFLEESRAGNSGRFFKQALVWAALGVLVFFAADPYLWPDPLGRLRESIFYHAGYASSAAEVDRASYPAWQPFFWLSFSPYWWHEGAFIFPFDPFILILALFGLKRLWSMHRVYALWLAIGMAFLLVWPTKWPQYIVTLTVPLSLASGQGAITAWHEIVDWWRRRKSRLAQVPEKRETRRALPWLVPGLIAFALLTLIPLIFQIGTSMTDFSTSSLRDGLHGGIWRAVWQGLSGQEPVTQVDIGTRSNEVHYTGLSLFQPVLNIILTNGFLFFNVMWTVLSVLLQAVLGLGVALLLWQKGIRLGKFWQALFILPWAIPEMIGALMWSNIFQPLSGWLPLAAAKFGPESFFASLVNALDNSPSLWLFYFLLPAVWYGFPFLMLAASVGLKAIPRDVLDASSIDGATPWQAFRFIIWPLLLPLLAPALIVRGIFSFNQFYLFQIFGYWNATLATLSYNIFNPNSGYGPYGGQFAVSAVINIIAVVILVVFVVLFNRWSRAGEGVTYA